MIKTNDQMIRNPTAKKNEHDKDVLKITLEDFIANALTNNRYEQTNLKHIYSKLKGCKPSTNMNYFIKNGLVVIAPESGLGFEKDLNTLMYALGYKQKTN